MSNNNKMLIDAAHPEETRVVVLRDGRVEEFDYESAARKLLRGNIYLAKVTRVEPSLQAAFVDYGGNRHGFLAFSEIHPDYYQIPVADREALKQEEAEAEAAADAAAEARAERRARQQSSRRSRKPKAAPLPGVAEPGAEQPTIDAAPTTDDARNDSDPSTDQPAALAEIEEATAVVTEDLAAAAPANDDLAGDPLPEPEAERQEKITSLADAVAADLDEPVADDAAAGTDTDDPVKARAPRDTDQDSTAHDSNDHDGSSADTDDLADDDEADDELAADGSDDSDADDDTNGDSEAVEEVGSEDALEEIAQRPRRRARQYKIQEVIKRRQVLLVQVVKEERGNKGAALTTYLSLAGRYTVLMPNTGRGGGISRKITQPADRKRLKAIAAELDVPEGMGLIIRTAGAARTKAEIKRDFEYLLRLWESVRELTLESSAPNLVYEEGNLIKRSIRDLYSKEVSEICVAGAPAHHEAKEFMGMLMPSHAKNVIAYKDPEPLFAKYQIERQLNAMFSPYVTLRSGGYIVINQTEALVSVDVNSGKSTREFSIEQTALNTNLEASEEVARQLKLRDLAGLIVIDFIDMEEKRNNRAVERKIKECLKTDRARIQVGRISHFGLLEMSRQRMRTGVLEGSTTQCPHCSGTGVIRSTESVALGVLRALEDTLIVNSKFSLTATTTTSVALYILNNKRAFLDEMEHRYGVKIEIEADDNTQGANFSVEKSADQSGPRKSDDQGAVSMEWGFEGGESDKRAAGAAAADSGDDSGEPKKRRRRRRRKNDDDRVTQDANGSAETAAQSDDAAPDDDTPRQASDQNQTVDGDDEAKPRRRRRGRRGGRRKRAKELANAENGGETSEAGSTDADAGAADDHGDSVQPEAASAESAAETTSGSRRRRRPAHNDSGHDTGSERNAKAPVNGNGHANADASDEDLNTGTAGEDDALPLPGETYRKPNETGENTAAPELTTAAIETTPNVAPERAPESQPAQPAADNKPSRKGWWQRAFSGGE